MPVGSNTVNIAVLPGDGIGTEVTNATLAVLEPLGKRHGIGLSTETLPAGAFHYQATGEALPDETFRRAEAADAILLGAMGWPGIRYPDGTEIGPQLDLRIRLGLYAGVRPVRAIPGVPVALADPRAREMDFVILRESTEGLFHSRGRGTVTEDAAEETLRITRATTEKLSRFAFRLAERRAERLGRRGTVTLIDKANVFRAFAFMRAVFDGVAAEFPGVDSGHHYVDAAALDMLRRPWTFDVLPTENMFGDILSDLGAGLVGGMGFSPSADIGDEPRRVPARPRHRARHRRQGLGQPDRHAALGGDDAGLARLARRRPEPRRRRPRAGGRGGQGLRRRPPHARHRRP